MSSKIQQHKRKTLKLSLNLERLKQDGLKLFHLFRRKDEKLQRREESDGWKIHTRKKGQPEEQLWGNEVQSIRQRSEEKDTGKAAEPPDRSAPLVRLRTPLTLMLSVTLCIEEIVPVASQKRQLVS